MAWEDFCLCKSKKGRIDQRAYLTGEQRFYLICYIKMIYNSQRRVKCFPSKAFLHLTWSSSVNYEALVCIVNMIIHVYQWQNLCTCTHAPHLVISKQHLPSGTFFLIGSELCCSANPLSQQAQRAAYRGMCNAWLSQHHRSACNMCCQWDSVLWLFLSSNKILVLPWWPAPAVGKTAG